MFRDVDTPDAMYTSANVAVSETAVVVMDRYSDAVIGMYPLSAPLDPVVSGEITVLVGSTTGGVVTVRPARACTCTSPPTLKHMKVTP